MERWLSKVETAMFAALQRLLRDAVVVVSKPSCEGDETKGEEKRGREEVEETKSCEFVWRRKAVVVVSKPSCEGEETKRRGEETREKEGKRRSRRNENLRVCVAPVWWWCQRRRRRNEGGDEVEEMKSCEFCVVTCRDGTEENGGRVLSHF